MSAATRTLLFGIFVLAGRRLTAPQVIRLARPLGVSATNVKSHLTRLVAEGALQRSGPARRAQYWVSPGQAVVVQGIVARLGQTPEESWNRTWLVLALRMPHQRASRERLRAMLWFDGFRPVGHDTFARPGWPKRWALGRAQHYLAIVPGTGVCGTQIGAEYGPDVNALYNLNALHREAQQLARWIRGRRVSAGSPGRAFALRLAVGGRVARLAGHDPRLPPELWGRRTGMRELVRAFRLFETRIAPLAERFVEEAADSG